MSQETKNMIWITLILVVLMVGGFYFWNKTASTAQAPKIFDLSQVVAENSHRIGTPSAKVTVTEFGDYECPACGAAYPATKEVIAEYKDNPDFAFVFRNYPLAQHRQARISAQFAEAAALQGKFWEMHDAIYEGQDKWSVAPDATKNFVAYGATLGLDVQKLVTDAKSDAVIKVIDDDQTAGNAIDVNSTPTFFVNGVEQTDWSAVKLSSAIDTALAQ